ncbi:hypothetical protein NMY22_g7512 [Coprinellus aureogranulatus]|nr:hypothetical protein NMY22_g7512 [Coprinellus aureogranulatus]
MNEWYPSVQSIWHSLRHPFVGMSLSPTGGSFGRWQGERTTAPRYSPVPDQGDSPEERILPSRPRQLPSTLSFITPEQDTGSTELPRKLQPSSFLEPKTVVTGTEGLFLSVPVSHQSAYSELTPNLNFLAGVGEANANQGVPVVETPVCHHPQQGLQQPPQSDIWQEMNGIMEVNNLAAEDGGQIMQFDETTFIHLTCINHVEPGNEPWIETWPLRKTPSPPRPAITRSDLSTPNRFAGTPPYAYASSLQWKRLENWPSAKEHLEAQRKAAEHPLAPSLTDTKTNRVYASRAEVTKKKLKIACHFCRQRKIRCCIPEVGKSDRTCNAQSALREEEEHSPKTQASLPLSLFGAVSNLWIRVSFDLVPVIVLDLHHVSPSFADLAFASTKGVIKYSERAGDPRLDRAISFIAVMLALLAFRRIAHLVDLRYLQLDRSLPNRLLCECLPKHKLWEQFKETPPTSRIWAAIDTRGRHFQAIVDVYLFYLRLCGSLEIPIAALSLLGFLIMNAVSISRSDPVSLRLSLSL